MGKIIMKEILEIRINYEFATLLFNKEEGKNIGTSVKVIELLKEDPRYNKVPIIDQEIRSKYDRAFFFGWNIKRKYSTKELDASILLQLKIKTTFEPSGEDCGTLYDETETCKICGVNRKQIGPLLLSKKSIPKKDIARTIAGEIVVSNKFKNLFEKNNLKGMEFKQVYSKETPINFFQIIPTSPELQITQNTITGIDPFDLSETSDGEIYKCPNGHTLGLNLISEIYVKKIAYLNNFDFFQTEQKIGVKRGLLRPEPLYLCSKKMREIIVGDNLKGFDFEVTHLE